MKIKNKIFKYIIYITTSIALLLLVFMIAFILKESLPFLKNYGCLDFVFGRQWNPIEPQKFGVFNIIAASLYIALLACIISSPVAYGISLYISFYTKGKVKKIIRWLVNILAGIPSIIYGFFGLYIVVKSFERIFRMGSGESVLAGATILSIMLLPFFVSNLVETIDIIKLKYKQESDALGVSKEYFIRKIVIKKTIKTLIISFILALSRGAGETMAVMMVIGNAPIFPHILSKAETIASLIALEVGMSEVGSIHYQALYSSALILLLIVFIIDLLVFVLNKKWSNDL